MARTDEQIARDTVYAEVFADRPALRHVLDDLQEAIKSFPDDQQAGGWRLYGHIQLRASALRRDQRRGKERTKA